MSEPDRWGPLPTRTDRPRAAALRVLRALVGSDGITVAALSERLGGHPNSIRLQLERLVAAGFAETAVPPSDRRGRPSHAYTATLAGRQVADQDGGLADQPALIEAVADHVAAGPDPVADAVELGRAWGRRIAGGAPHQELAKVLSRQGFTPTPVPAGLLLQTCPLLSAARDRPELVCGIHRGMLEAVAGREVGLRPFADPAGCLVLDRPHP